MTSYKLGCVVQFPETIICRVYIQKILLTRIKLDQACLCHSIICSFSTQQSIHRPSISTDDVFLCLPRVLVITVWKVHAGGVPVLACNCTIFCCSNTLLYGFILAYKYRQQSCMI